MNSHIHPLIAGVLQKAGERPRTEEQIIRDMNAHNKETIFKLRNHVTLDKEEAIRKRDRLIEMKEYVEKRRTEEDLKCLYSDIIEELIDGGDAEEVLEKHLTKYYELTKKEYQ